MKAIEEPAKAIEEPALQIERSVVQIPENISIKDLKQLAKENGVKMFSRMNKAKLLEGIGKINDVEIIKELIGESIVKKPPPPPPKTKKLKVKKLIAKKEKNNLKIPENISIKDLKQLAKENGVKMFSRMNKAKLLEGIGKINDVEIIKESIIKVRLINRDDPQDVIEFSSLYKASKQTGYSTGSLDNYAKRSDRGITINGVVYIVQRE